eukprot:14370023-Alexandrium_andersonii.AAC.1
MAKKSLEQKSRIHPRGARNPDDALIDVRGYAKPAPRTSSRLRSRKRVQHPEDCDEALGAEAQSLQNEA